MPVAQQDQWRQDPASGDEPGADGAEGDAIARLEAALARIAAAAGRQQDQLRVADLTARTAQYELETLLHDRQAQDRTLNEAVAHRLDALIATVQEALGEAPPTAASTDRAPAHPAGS